MEQSLGQAIKSFRQKEKLQQKYVALTSGLRPQRYSSIENGRAPSGAELDQIAAALNTDAATLAVYWADQMRESHINRGSNSVTKPDPLVYQNRSATRLGHKPR